MDRMWDSIKRSLQDGAAIAFDKAEGLTQVGRARLDIAAAKTRVSRLKTQLGEVVFGHIEAGQGGGLADDEAVRDLCDQIRDAAMALQAAEEDFDQVRSDLEGDAAEDDQEPPREAPLGT
jgi:hypothetical protein